MKKFLCISLISLLTLNLFAQELKVLGPIEAFLSEETTLSPITESIFFQKSMQSSIICSPVFASTLECRTQLSSYVTNNGYITGTNSSFNEIGVMMLWKVTTGRIDSILAFIQAKGSKTGSVSAKLYNIHYNDSTITIDLNAPFTTSEPINLSNIDNSKISKFTFSSPVTISNPVLVTFNTITENPTDSIVLLTTAHGCSYAPNWLVAKKSDTLFSINQIFTYNSEHLSIEGCVLLYGSFTIDNTNINEINANNKESQIYPNPTSNLINIDNAANSNIEIYNILGEKVKTVANSMDKTSIDVSDLNNGMYIIKIQNGNSIETKKIQISR